MFSRLRAALLAGVLGGANTEVLAEPNPVVDRFEAAAQAGSKYATGVAYSVGDKLPVQHVSGVTERSGDRPVTENAAWHIGSISKSFTATLVLQQVEAGRLELNAPIGTYLTNSAPDLHEDWAQLTLRQLLSHTSGLAANAGFAVLTSATNPDPRIARVEILSKYWTKAPNAAAGDFEYSNLGYTLVGHILETVTDRSWEDLVEPILQSRLASRR